ncbi:FAD dependent oxidoreductase [Pseudoramibacter alactolyticus ATCC 23263]|uniref:FAD dependent oxidoreductase n=1 Tax=Pseudoramibacter alactolyticus ATCC 23263 TaxID=887929 RepID=E6MG25_9FIRM|nr:NAD(P)/FAD-dependent oxidoreductase [Pseudoramibacter alactolyticus]EFV01565.1 FAD dependent oxidoreductase [Pseudoramibacter alactolyticus ATCC 23263]
MKTDILIIGAGVIGSAVARKLSQYDLDITLVEKQSDVCMGTSKANSSMIHSGYNVDGSKLKGQMCLKSDTKVYDKFCKELNVDFRHTGSVFAGFEESHLKTMKEEVDNAKKNGLEGVRIVDHDEMMQLEPNINPDVKFGLFDPNTGTINPFEWTMALAENAAMNGVKVLLNAGVTNIHTANGKIARVDTEVGTFESRIVINCAGLYSDKIAAMVEDIDFYVHPRKGEYFLYDKKWGGYVNHCIYSPPTPVSKGMIIVPTTEGNLLCGSNAVEIDDKTDFSTTQEGLDDIYARDIHKLFPALPRVGDVITAFAGLRPASSTEDFIIGHAKSVPTMINLVGIQSPGLSSAPAVADMVDDIVHEVSGYAGLILKEKPDWNPIRPKPIVLRDFSKEERSELIKQNPDYGKIICRCETISKGEILDAIRRLIPARNIDAIKRRTRAGMGRCQGGFCGPRVVNILNEELGIDPLDVTKRGGRSNILLDKTKDLSLFEGGIDHEKIEL